MRAPLPVALLTHFLKIRFPNIQITHSLFVLVTTPVIHNNFRLLYSVSVVFFEVRLSRKSWETGQVYSVEEIQLLDFIAWHLGCYITG